MTLQDFKDEVRATRGKLTKHETDLEVIYHNGIPELLQFTLEKKLMGVRNITWIALRPINVQETFIKWMASKNWKATKDELDLYLHV